MAKNKSPEQHIKNEILSYLVGHGVFCWPNDSVGIFDPIKRVYRKKNSIFAINGVSDILGIYKGKPLAIEVKSKVGRLSPQQELFLNRFVEAGGIAFMARSVDDVIIQLENSDAKS
jgi:penicillin-binding protein-related factor A (putative recombinase)